MVRLFRRTKQSEEATRLLDHPDVVRADPARMDSETRALYRDAREAQTDAAEDALREQGPRPFIVSNPFKFGFVVTLGVLAAILFGDALGRLSSLFVYIIAALFVSLGLDPVVRWLERHRVSRPFGIAIVFIGFILVLSGMLAIIVPMVSRQVALLVRQAPRFFTNINEQDWYALLVERFGNLIDFPGILDMARDFVSKPDNWAQFAGGVLQAGVGIANALAAGLIVLILTLYFLASLPAMKRGLYLTTPRSSRAQVIDITEQVTVSIGGYVNGMVLLALLNAILGFVAMSIIGVPFAGLLAVAVFFLALVPLIGSVLATVLVTVVALFDAPMTAVWIGLYYLVYMQVESYVLTPRIMSRVVSVPGTLVVIGAIAGGTLLGLLGALIAIPVTAMLLMILKQVWIPRQQFR